MSAISVRDLSFRYYRSSAWQLQGVNLEVEAGEFVAIWGDAKTTLCMCLCGVIPHLISGKMDGEVKVKGYDTRTTPIRDIATHVGVVLQDPENQLFNLTVEGDVAFGPENLRVPRSEMLQRIDRVLQLVRMEAFRHRASSELSGGQKQRVSIAAVLAMEPSILIPG
ncbi:MAG: energy-coupling factor ABC transporter ATP-binding protein [Firmicutes bacterium]|nr:energy-coupling factor ABC transporter ATP-binding protein [Bacillota bacterium]